MSDFEGRFVPAGESNGSSIEPLTGEDQEEVLESVEISRHDETTKAALRAIAKNGGRCRVKRSDGTVQSGVFQGLSRGGLIIVGFIDKSGQKNEKSVPAADFLSVQ